MLFEKREKKRISVTIFDQEYIVRSHEDGDYVKSLASHLDEKMREIKRKNQILSPYKVAVLAALNLTDELFKVQAEHEELIDLIEETKIR
ncbi:MAG: cell division protein ZapA [Bacillota bacterium]